MENNTSIRTKEQLEETRSVLAWSIGQIIMIRARQTGKIEKAGDLLNQTSVSPDSLVVRGKFDMLDMVKRIEDSNYK